MNLASSAARGAALTLGWQSCRVILQFVSVVVLARLIAPADIGLLAMVVAITGIAELIRDFGLSMAAVQAKKLSQDEKSNLFWINSGLGLALSLLIAALSGPIAAFYGQPSLQTIVLWTCVTFLLSGIATQFRAELNRNLRFTALSLSELVPQFLGFVAAVVTCHWSPTFWALIVQQLTGAVVGLLFVLPLARWWPSRPKRSVSVMHLARFGAGLAGTQAVAYFTKNLDNVAIGYMWGPASLGIYSRGYQLAMLPIQQITAPLSRVAIPILSRITDDDKRFLNYVLMGQSVSAVVASVTYGLLCGLAYPLIAILFGAKWLGMVPIVQALALGGIFRSLGQVSYWIFVARGLTGHQFRFNLATQPFIVVLMFAGLPWGGAGVAYGVFIGYVLLWFLQLYWVGRVSGLRTGELMRNGVILIATVAAPTTAIGLVTVEWIPNPWLAIPVALAAIAALYLLLFLVFKRPRERLKQLKQVYFDRKSGKAGDIS